MTPDFTLEELAKTRNWIVFGKALSAALDDPACHGFDDASQMLAHVAQLRGVDPSSLRNPLSAVNWMKQNAAEALVEENPKLAMTGVLTLSQISNLSSDLAENLIPKFFRGEVSRRQLQVALRNAEAKQGGRGVAANERVKRAFEFEDDVFRFLQRNVEVLEFGDNVEIVRSGRGALVPSDFIARLVGHFSRRTHGTDQRPASVKCAQRGVSPGQRFLGAFQVSKWNLD